jgi:hypothetical protein
MFAELGFDPAEGLLVHEATSVVGRRIPLLPSLATLLLQPAVYGTGLAHASTPFVEFDLAGLRDYLLGFFAPDHRCAFVRSAAGAGQRPQIAWYHLRSLTAAPYDTVVGTTLYIPAVPPDATVAR